MTKLFLLEESVDNLKFEEFQEGLDDIILIKKEENDIFYKNNNINQLENYSELYQNHSQENQFRAKFLEQINISNSNPKSIEELKMVFPDTPIGFMGINFPQLEIDKNLCVENDDRFKEFKKYHLILLNHSNLFFLKEICFSNIIFCDNSEEQLKSFGNGKYFHQCVEQLSILNEYLQNWSEGNFNYQNLNDSTEITLSPESKTTMNKHFDKRVFSLPNGGTDIFELHIKLRDIRIHILEDNVSKKIMVGYIGRHLPI
ncbi:hypothetical protein CAP47_09990 [Psychroflexus sp. S27]|uniref:hypothetical protein n=1 Tax=Psychroflexus sp. S27 TaxID=1982757 RepID=UPI000C2A920B|nr:hypothetical protein [Psychroflexus sp. S27]PJX21934.1 hypothetical protein CAP47_09990 [Psychroflexus sp. S27]